VTATVNFAALLVCMASPRSSRRKIPVGAEGRLRRLSALTLVYIGKLATLWMRQRVFCWAEFGELKILGAGKFESLCVLSFGRIIKSR
jgi:hypothetical protein